MSEVTPLDLERMFLGDGSWLYLLEILLRILVIWPWTMLLLRWIGGRSIAQLSLVEFLLVIALGSAVGDALFLPEVPLLHAMLVIFVVISIDKGIDTLARRWPALRPMIDGTPIEVMSQGVLKGDGLNLLRINSAELMEMLRVKGVRNLGSIERAWIEPSGQISLLPADPPRLGLAIMPPPTACLPEDIQGERCCMACGTKRESGGFCPLCKSETCSPAQQAPAYHLP